MGLNSLRSWELCALHGPSCFFKPKICLRTFGITEKSWYLCKHRRRCSLRFGRKAWGFVQQIICASRDSLLFLPYYKYSFFRDYFSFLKICCIFESEKQQPSDDDDRIPYCAGAHLQG